MFDFIKKNMSKLLWQQQEKTNWEPLPSDLLVKIIRILDLADSVRVSVVCRRWRSIVTENKLLQRCQTVWLKLPHNNNLLMSFFDLSDGMMYNIKLPETLQGGWCYGSSKGWLVFMALQGRPCVFSPQLILFNPISGEQCPLPPVCTLPFDESYLGYVDEAAYLSDYKIKIELSSADVPNCIVAAKFFKENFKSGLALCKPGDERWTIFQGTDEHEEDILFYNGELHVLISWKAAIAFETHTIKVGDHDGIITIIRLIANNCMSVFENLEDIWIPESESHLVWIAKDACYHSYLVESSDGELLIVHKILNRIETLLDYKLQNHYRQASRFEVFKIDVSISKFTKLISLGDQTLCVSITGSICVPAAGAGAGLKRNSIVFVEDYSEFSRESGVFHFEDGRIQRFFPSRKSVHYPRIIDFNTDPIRNWFSPNLK